MEKLLLLAGPAGTGKTESVKALGHQLGRFVLVFNCDETFDFQVLCERSYIFVQLGLSFFVLIFKNTTPPVFSRPWVVSSWVSAKWAPGAALTSSTVWRRECSLPSLSKSSTSKWP